MSLIPKLASQQYDDATYNLAAELQSFISSRDNDDIVRIYITADTQKAIAEVLRSRDTKTKSEHSKDWSSQPILLVSTVQRFRKQYNDTDPLPPTFDQVDSFTIITAYQILQFVKVSHSNYTKVRPEAIRTARYVVSKFSRPQNLDDTITSESRYTRSAEPSLERLPAYPYGWSADREHLKREVGYFLQKAAALVPVEWIPEDSEPASSRPDTTAPQPSGSNTRDPTIELPRSPIKPPSPLPMASGPSFSIPDDVASYIAEIVRGVMEAADARKAAVKKAAAEEEKKTSTSSAVTHENQKWRADEIGFFDPQLDLSFGEGDIVTVGKDIYYRSANVFCERVEDIATIKSADLVKANLNTCFRGAALQWYTTELTAIERQYFRIDPTGVKGWISAIKNRFKVPISDALSSLTTTKYTTYHARIRYEPSAYVQTMLRHAQNADMLSVGTQLMWAWQGIAPELRVFIDAPMNTTTVTSFIESLQRKQEAWFEMYRTSAPVRR